MAVVGCITIVAAPLRAAGATTSPATSGAPAIGGIGLRLLDVPIAERNDPRSSLYVVDHVAPGTSIQRRIEVSNTTASAEHIVTYAAGAAITKGSFLGAAGHTPDELSTWTSVSPGASEVVAGGSVTAIVTVDVPSDAASGERYAAVWAEVRSSTSGGGVVEVSRVGVRIYLSVGPGAPPASDFAIDSLTATRTSEGLPVVVAVVRNSGGRALDMNGTLQLTAGPGGLRAGPFPASLGVTLAIGDTEPVEITLDNRIPAGPWDATVVLHSGSIERRARGTVTFPASGTSTAVRVMPPGSQSSRGALAGIVALLLALVVALSALGVVVTRKLKLSAGQASLTKVDAFAAHRHPLSDQ